MRLKKNSLCRLMLPILAQVVLPTGAGAADIKITLQDSSSSLVVNSSDNTTRLKVNDNATAMGRGTTASGKYSTAMGQNTTASGVRSFAIGYYTTASGQASTASGHYSTASGKASTALAGSTASGDYSTAMGGGTASGYRSTASGKYTNARGDYSTASGYSADASGKYSTAMGANTTASGKYSTTMGNSTTASGKASTAMGYATTAYCYAQTTIGIYSKTETLGQNGWCSSPEETGPLFVIGNGTNGGNKRNALVVYSDGDATLSGSLTENSDRRLKQNIVPLVDSLEKVQQLRGVSYEWIDPNRPRGRHLGFIAQEVQEVLPELVHQNGDFLSLSYSTLTSVLVEAVKEQQTEIEQVQSENDALESEIEQAQSENDVLEAQVETLESENRKLWGRLEAIEALLQKTGLLK